ncbi:hypothetical protein IRP70_001012 [Salmonella enterica]|nr:hypothetical protein [Salmonella enterica]EGM2979650.1 hypothetical protein [Salmonella enterica]
MNRNRQVNKVVHFLLTLLIMFAVSIAPAQALLKSGTWQELNSTTGAVNGTAPLADGATIPLYQGSMLLDPTKTYDIEFTAMPRDFSADASSTSMRAVNSTDTEGDLFTDPPSIAWENQEPPTMSLVWADAATPDTPLSPQPILNQTFCAQNLAGRQLVAWAQVEDENNVPALWLYTRTGVPNNAVIPLLSPKVTLNIKPAVSDPVSVSGDHIDANFAASKVKAGESITLTVSTKACNGDVAPNAAFVIRREDAINRQGVVNNANPVRVGDTELTTTQTEYHGVTDGQGNATVVVTQEQGPGVKTRLIVSSQSYPTLTDNVDVIFTTITSPDSDKANMYGHMLENATATLNGTTYTFTRPKLAAETSGNDGTVVDTNETWAQFTWSGADNHCDILPDAEQLVALRHEHSALATYTGWPVTGDAEYWSSTKDQINDYHAAVHMNSASVVRAANSDTLLVSCVDKAQPAAHPQITLSPEGPYKAQVGESIDLVMTVVDRDTQKPLPYRYMELFIDPAKNRKGEHQDAWDNQRVTINTEDMRASSPEHYTGVTDANGQVHLTLKHDSGLGVETPIRIVMPDDEGGSVELPFSVIFTVITSPDVDGANMWGHMQGVVDAGNLYRRPLLAVETSHKDGQFSENNEEWATFNSVEKASLYDTPTVISSLPAVFTVITSPNSDKANMYGHMPETFTASNGAKFTRPLLYDELSSRVNTTSYSETNETWFTVNYFNTGNYGACPINQMATLDDLTSLYDDHPKGKVTADIGLPIKKKWWAGDSLLKNQTIYWQFTDLSTGKDGTISETPGNFYYQLCLTEPRSAAASLTLTLAGQDETTGIVKAKKGEQIAATVTVKDAVGQPMKNVMVKISRGVSYSRANSVTSSSGVADDITLRDVMPSGLATYLLDTSAKYLYVETDELGQVTFTLAQDSTTGLKTTISAATMDGSNLTDSKDAIFTVITSPDTDKATYWGHMPETFTNSKGVEFARPLLRAELSSTTDTSGYSANGETWYTWSRYPNLYQDSASPCDCLGLPTMDDLKTLYSDYPQGGLTAAFGLPVAAGKYWGAGDSKVNDTHSTNNFQYIRLNTGETTTTSTNTATAQLCLTKRRVLSIALTSSAMNAEKSAALAKKGEKIPLTVTVTDGDGTPQPNVPIRLGRGNYSQNRAGGDENGSNSDMLLTPIALPADAKVFAYHYSGEQLWYWYGTTDESGRVQFELTQDNTPGLKTRLEAMLPDNPPTVSDMDAIFTVITSPDSDKAKYWGHMPEIVTNSAGVKFRRPLLAAEMTSNSGTYLVNNEKWPLVTAANTEKAGATGCDAEYQPLSGDLQTLYGDNPNGAIGTNYGWPVAGNKSWWAADRAPNTGYYQFINLNSGGKGTASSSTATGAQVCLVEPHTSTPASITLTSTAMDSAKNAAVVEKGSAMPLTVTVKDSSGNPVANVGFTLSRGDSKNRAGTVVTDGDVAADAGADDLMLKALTPASASQSMTTTGIVFIGTTGSDGTATFTLNQDKSLGLKTPLTVKLTYNTALHASLDVIFMVLTSPDTDKALFWGNMADTTSVNGKTLHRPWLQAELLSGVMPVFTNGVHTNNEYWAMAHTVDNTKWDIAKQCGSLSKAPDNNDLLTLYHSISSLGWPTQGYPYLSKSTSGGGMYCGVDENTRNQNCAIKPASSAGYATCVD